MRIPAQTGHVMQSVHMIQSLSSGLSAIRAALRLSFLATGLLALVAMPSAAATVTLTAVDIGRVDQSGFHDRSAFGIDADGVSARAFVIFDLSGITQTVLSARWESSFGGSSSTLINMVTDDDILFGTSGLINSTAVFDDLGDGIIGFLFASLGSGGRTTELSNVSAINATTNLFAIGLSGPYLPGYSNLNEALNANRLILQTVPLPAALSLFAGGLGLLGLLGWRRKRLAA